MIPYFVPSGTTRSQFEERIADELHEIAAAFDPIGTMIVPARRGGPFEVGFTDAEAGLLSGAVVTHNHPLGGPLSGEDARFATDFDLAEMRAVLPTRIVYSIKRPPEGWPKGDEMQEAAEQCIGERFAESAHRSARGLPRMSGREAEAFLFESQRNAFRETGVELSKTNAWE